MYCPNCSQQQSSENSQFCTRCGFPLEFVSEMLANDGNLPELVKLRKSREKTIKRVKIFSGLAFWIIVGFLGQLISAISNGNQNEIIIGAVGLALGIFILIVSLPLLKPFSELNKSNKILKNKNPSPGLFEKHSTQKILMPLENSVVNDYVAPINFGKVQTTKDLIEPSGVTEETTKFLEKNK